MLWSIVCLFLACYVAACAAERAFIPGCDQTNEGNEFYVGFIRNRFGRIDEQERIPPVLWITTKESTPVNFEVFTFFGFLASGVATPGEITYVTIPLGLVVFDSTVDSDRDTRFKGIRIKAEDDRRIVVFGQNEEVASNDAYLGLPVISLPVGRSYEYIAASIFGDSGTVSQDKDSVALIIGTEDDTEIILEPSVVIRHLFAPAETGGQFIPGVPVQFRTVTIQRFQTFYLQVRGGDISGTRIIANKPISVFSGHECANIPLASQPCDTVIEQLPLIDTWGTEVVTVPLRTRSGDVLKVFASQASTTVNIAYTNINNGAVTTDTFTLGRNGFRELGGASTMAAGAISDFALIQSNNPIAVFQFSRSFETDNVIVSDPFMLTVPPCEQYRNMYAVATAPFNETIAGTVAGRVAYVNYTNIAVPAEYFNASLITVNNNSVNASEFRPIRRADNTTWGYGAQLQLDEGVQVIRHSDPNAALSVTMYGFSNQMSWGYIAGTGLAPVALSVVSFEATNGGSGVAIVISESGGPLVVVLVLSEAVDEEISVFVIATNVTARAGEDFGPSQNYTVTFPAGSTRQSVDIPIINDTVLEPDETFSLEISVPEATVRAGVIDGCDPFTPRQTVRITDNDDFTVMFEQPAYNVSENAGPAQPVLVLSNPSSTAFTVQVNNTDGSATGGGVDYESGPYSVMFPAGVTRVPFNVTINNDMISEANENFMLTIDPDSLPTGGSVGIPGSAVVTIIDDDPITVMFNQTTYSVNENAGPARPVLVLSNPASMTFEVQVTNTDGSATGGSAIGGGVDYVSGPYTVTFSAGMTSVPFNIPINNDNVFEGDENFMLTIDPNSLPNDVSVTVGSPDQATVTIVDNDPITVMFSDTTYNVTENAGPARPVLVLSNPSSMDFNVTVTNTDGSATGGVDYGSGPYIVTIPAGMTRVPFDVPITDDGIQEGNEDFMLTINPSLPTGVTVGSPDQATVTIVDDEVTTVMFEQSTYSVNENAGPAQPVLVLSNPSSTAFNVTVTNTDGSATGGVDYGSGPYTVMFPAGETRVPFNISINNDRIYEGNEDFMLTINPTLPVGIMVGTPDQATVTIVDNDPFTVMFEQPAYNVSESAGPAQPVLVLSNPSSTDFNVTVTNTDGSATGGGVDYGSGPYTVTFPAGTTSVPFDVPINNDDILEGNEDFTLTIDPASVPTGGSVGSPDQATVTIVDNDPITVMFSDTTYSVNENAGPAQPVLVLSNPSSTNFNVIVTNTDGSATGGVDYGSGPYTVTIPAGMTSVPFNISITDDGILEGNEDFMLTINPSPLPTGVSVGSPDQATVTIVDVGSLTVMFEQSTYSVNENAGPARPVLVLSGPSSTDVVVEVTNTDGSATGGVDYGSGPYTVTFPAGTTRVPFNVSINNDDILEDNEDFMLTINPSSVPTGVTVGSPDQATVTIVDDDPITVMFDRRMYSVDENAGPAQPMIVLSNPSSMNMTVEVRNVNNTAISGDDYSPGIYSVMIPAGQTMVPFDIGIVNDDILEGNEDFDIVIIGATLPNRVSRGNPSRSTVTIVDNDTITVMFSDTTYDVNENTGPARPVLVLSNPSSTDIEVTVNSNDGSATGGGVDYGSGPYVVTIPAGMTMFPFDIPIINDDIYEGVEDFMITIDPATLPDNVTVGTPGEATVNIVDDDTVTVRFANATGTVTEGDGTVTIRIEKVGDAEIPVNVTVTTSDGTATAGSDYGTDGNPNPPVITPITIPAGESSVDITVPILDDNCREEDETFNGELSVISGQPRVTLGTPDRTVITIVDDDVSTVEFLNAPYTVVEGSGAYNVCLSITPACDLGAMVTIGTSPKDALPGSDYMAVTRTVTFAPNQMVACIDMNNIIDDSAPEPMECFQLVIMVPPGSRLVPGDNANVTIIDDDPTGPTVFFNDTVIGDPLYEVPMNMISNQTFRNVTSLCYEIHGEAGQIFNLISDGCVQVNANYSAMNIPENGNIISQIGVLAYDNANGCAFITVDVNNCIPVVNGVPYNDTVYDVNGVTARRRNGRARITVPNCDGDADDLVFWVVCQEISGQRMIKFQVMRGSSLQPDSHGLIGQFWNIPVTATGPISPPIANITNAFRVRVEPQLSQPRSFVAELFQRTWDRTLKPCLYAGNSQGGPISEVANDASVIEGEYFEYKVADGIFGTRFTYNRLQARACPR